MDRRKQAWRKSAALRPKTQVVIAMPVEVVDDSGDVERVDGIEFDYRKEARCKVCSAGASRRGLPNGEEVRRRVDALLVQGRTYRDILETVTPLMTKWPAGRRPSYYSIRNHQLRHLPVDQFAVREIIERRAAARRLQVAVGRGPLVTSAAVFEVVRMKGFEAISSGAIAPSVRETLEAARLLEELDGETGNELEDLRASVDVLLSVLREHLPAELLEAVVAEHRSRLSHGRPGPLGSAGRGREAHASGVEG
jgi:hypothetical protein